MACGIIAYLDQNVAYPASCPVISSLLKGVRPTCSPRRPISSAMVQSARYWLSYPTTLFNAECSISFLLPRLGRRKPQPSSLSPFRGRLSSVLTPEIQRKDRPPVQPTLADIHIVPPWLIRRRHPPQKNTLPITYIPRPSLDVMG